jgi:hypothetical protein
MPEHSKKHGGGSSNAVPEGPEYLMAYRGGFKGGLVGGVIGAIIAIIVCFICHYMMAS